MIHSIIIFVYSHPRAERDFGLKLFIEFSLDPFFQTFQTFHIAFDQVFYFPVLGARGDHFFFVKLSIPVNIEFFENLLHV